MNEPADPAQESIEDLQDELRWDKLFQRTQSQLAAAQRAKQQIAAGKASPSDTNQHGGPAK